MPQFDLYQHLLRQIAFSRATFGPDARTAGVIDHIRKELVEVEESGGDPEEWVDVVILGLDGLTRAIRARYMPETIAAFAHCIHEDVAEEACTLILEKQNKNELRDWPDWRTAAPDKAITHVKTSTTDCGCGTPYSTYTPDPMTATTINNEWLEKMGSDQLAHAIANGVTVDNRIKPELWFANQGYHPVPYYYTVRVIRRDWSVTEGPASSFDWVLTGSDHDIMQYRIIQKKDTYHD